MESQFEQHGYFETLVDLDTGQQIGNRDLGKDLPAGRVVGSAGGKNITISENITLQRGHKTVIYKVRKPHEFYSIIFPICGRMIKKP